VFGFELAFFIEQVHEPLPKLVASGTHRELVVSDGMYAQMYNLHQQILDGSVAEEVV